MTECLTVNDINDLLSPHLMSDESIRKTLIRRCINIPDIDVLQRSKLLDIYSRVILPLEQRVSRPSRHSKQSDEKTEKNEINNRSNFSTKLSDNIRKIRINSEDEREKKLVKLNQNDKKDISANNLKRNMSVLSDDTVPLTKKTKQKISWP